MIEHLPRSPEFKPQNYQKKKINELVLEGRELERTNLAKNFIERVHLDE